jgi:hypothetical protein
LKESGSDGFNVGTRGVPEEAVELHKGSDFGRIAFQMAGHFLRKRCGRGCNFEKRQSNKLKNYFHPMVFNKIILK